MRRAAAAAVVAMLAVAGCGGGSSTTGTGGHGGEGGSAGAIGTGGALVTGGTGGAGLPTCPILTHPASDGGACSTLVAAGPLVLVAPVIDNFQGGVVEDGGVQVQPAGGTILDGDYDLVRWENSGSNEQRTRRTMRVFAAGSYVEWDAAVATGDAGFTDHRYDTENTASARAFAVNAFACGITFPIYSYGYTATGDDLTFFNYTGGSDGNGDVFSVDRYRRTCTRP